jgi:hypothetical protein
MAEIRCNRTPWSDGVELAVFDRRDFGMTVAEPLTMRPINDGEFIGEPTLRMTNAEAQMLTDELWRCGWRPSEGSGSAGSLAATERHLKDMQRIAMGLLKKDGTEV